MKQYCLRCNCWQEFTNLTEKEHINNTMIIRGECHKCGLASCHIRGKSEWERLKNEDKKKHERD